MSNILIIKHGSLGDLIQANGAIQDIKNTYKKSKVLLLTTGPFIDFMSQCPYIDGVILDKRLPRWNLIYLMNLRKLLYRYKFSNVFDLQNSNRTRFYRRYLVPKPIWSSTDTTLSQGEAKKDFNKEPVLDRMEIQLRKDNINLQNIKNVDLSWADTNINRLIKQHTNNEYILIFPFCSKKHINKKWPYYKDLVNKININYKNKYAILIAPGPDEIKESKNFNAKIFLDGYKSINLIQLVTLIRNAKFIISNDTGPAHICTHLNKKGLVLFGNHTSAEKVSMGTSEFKTITVKKLEDLDSNTVLEEIKKTLD